MPSSIQNTQERQQQLPLSSSMVINRPRKKCHGNRKLQRFKKKCLKRGLNKEEIQKLIDEHQCRAKKGRNQIFFGFFF